MMTAGMLLFARIGAQRQRDHLHDDPRACSPRPASRCRSCPRRSPPRRARKQGQTGLASGLVNTSRQVGGGLGLAVLITLATQHTSHLIGAGVPGAAGADRRLPPRLPDRRRASPARRAGHVRLVPGPAAELRSAARARRSPSRRRDRRGFVAARLRVRQLDTGAPIGAYTTQRRLQLRLGARRCTRRRSRPTCRRPRQLAPGYIFTANFYDLNYPPMVGQSGPLILDDQLQPVWFQPGAR